MDRMTRLAAASHRDAQRIAADLLAQDPHAEDIWRSAENVVDVEDSHYRWLNRTATRLPSEAGISTIEARDLVAHLVVNRTGRW